MSETRDWGGWIASRMPVEGPSRGATTIETLAPGDVNDQGEILLRNGAYAVSGLFWLPETQALAAEYYGWRFVAGHLSVTREGDVLYPMRRG